MACHPHVLKMQWMIVNNQLKHPVWVGVGCKACLAVIEVYDQILSAEFANGLQMGMVRVCYFSICAFLMILLVKFCCYMHATTGYCILLTQSTISRWIIEEKDIVGEIKELSFSLNAIEAWVSLNKSRIRVF